MQMVIDRCRATVMFQNGFELGERLLLARADRRCIKARRHCGLSRT